MTRVVLVRYGEIGLKGRNRPLFEERLVANIRGAVRDLPVRVRKEFGRIVIDGEESCLKQAIEKVSPVFGVVSTSPALAAPLEMDRIAEAAEVIVSEVLQKEARPGRRSFKVETRRPNKRFPLQSPQISAQLGAALLKRFPELVVNVEAPDFVVWVEVRERVAYVYADVIPGFGGLPIGTSGKGLLLLSGGIDSPVAGWLALKRGIAVEAIHFHSFPYTSEQSLEKVVDLARLIGAGQGYELPLHVIPFTRIQEEIEAHSPAPARITVMRRMMLRIAEALAKERGIPALITGESVGQVASQTLESMAVINAVTSMPILRPLVTMDKSEIVDLAKRIGTYETSILPYDDCCSLFVPAQPETKPRLERIEAAERRFDVAGLVAEAVAQAEVKA